MNLIFLLPNVFVFILGLCVGSFLNCVIYRLEKKQSLRGRSACPICKHELSWQDLIPVFSFLFLGRKCRYCKAKISAQYPLVELTTGLIFLLILKNFVNFQYTTNFAPANFVVYLNLLFLFYITSSLIVIFVYDLKHYIIPDKILFPAIAVAFVYRFLDFENLNLFRISDFGFRIFAPLGGYLLAAAIGSGFFLFIFLISGGRWMGFGDVKLAVLMGLLLGFPNVLAGLFLAFFFGAIIGIILMIFGKKNLKSEIPFGPFLIAGTFIALFWGQEIIGWYVNLFV